ncbi:hypothetical protein FRC14_000091 [Serendipita sp. 396]|nr:hypothetical protein FRC14_000091 [Serendipita sp. 396]KAG8789828.1 hypothetical protein FRC15_000020 [Serendipita sp. 397]KAG8804830.1 hypothetical protein FRC16_000084 [Serendipita sp. 398]KAG8879499.1 hypothetical protein FRC20_000071 [Serendipita sp. 405]
MKLSTLTFLLLVAGGVAAIPVEDSSEGVETESGLDEVTTFDADAGDVLVTSADDIYTPDVTDGTLVIPYENDSRACGNTLTQSEVATIEGQFPAALSNFSAQSTDTIAAAAITRASIPVVWHVIYTSKTVAGGYISDSVIKKSISAMNTHYRGSGFGFKLKQIKRKKNTNWFKKMKGKATDSYMLAMKNALHTGGASTLNVYTVDFADGTLGLAAFPWEYYGFPKRDGVVIQYNSYPGGSLANYNQGKTLTHEVGHWLGVYHVFQGEDCNSKGDYVDDTPEQSTATFGCPSSKNSCPQSGNDSIHNYMDYSYDKCMTGFTKEQMTRATQMSNAYRF